MPKLPTDATQQKVIRTLEALDGILVKGAGKGSHQRVRMPNGLTTTVQSGKIPQGTLRAILRQVKIDAEDFIGAYGK